MSPTTLQELPRELLERLHASDESSGGNPKLPGGGRETASAWLNRVLVDFEALNEHIRLLQSLYGSPFCYPRPRRDCWDKSQLTAPPAAPNFRHRERLEQGLVVAIADGGPEVFSRPEVITDAQLAKLLVNPVALYDLHDAIDELQPERWLGVMQAVGHEVARREGLHARPKWFRTVGQTQTLRWGAIAALAGCLLIGLLGGLAWKRGGGSKPFEVLVAQAETRALAPRGAADGGRKVIIRSDRKGFVSIIALFVREPPLVFPGIASGSIPVLPGEATESPPFPTGLDDATVILVVVTEQPASDVIRRALDGATFAPDQTSQLQALLAEKLDANNYHWAAFTRVELQPTKGQ